MVAASSPVPKVHEHRAQLLHELGELVRSLSVGRAHDGELDAVRCAPGPGERQERWLDIQTSTARPASVPSPPSRLRPWLAPNGSPRGQTYEALVQF